MIVRKLFFERIKAKAMTPKTEKDMRGLCL